MFVLSQGDLKAYSESWGLCLGIWAGLGLLWPTKHRGSDAMLVSGLEP